MNQCSLPGCPNMFDIDHAYSIVAFVALTSVTGIPSSNCPQGQHFNCSADHAVQMSAYCVTNHLTPIISPPPPPPVV